MTIDWWTLGLQTVNVLILLWILARFLFRPVAKIIAERQAAAHAALDEAETAKHAAEAARAEAEAARQAVLRERAEKIAEVRKDAEAEKQRLMAEVQAELDKARGQAKDELARQGRAQQEALSEQAGVLAGDIADRLLARLPKEARVAGFIDGLVEAVAQLPESTRAGIGLHGPVPLRAAQMPTEAEIAQLRDGLDTTLGRAVEIEVTEAPELIAGLELDTATAIVRNHFRADLDRITAEVRKHD